MADTTDQKNQNNNADNSSNPEQKCSESKDQLNGIKPLQFPSNRLPRFYSMTFKKYNTKTSIDRITGSNNGVKESAYSQIRLPLPSSIVDNSTVGYTTPELGLLGRGVGEIAETMTGIAEQAQRDGLSAESISSSVMDASSNMINSVKQNIQQMNTKSQLAVVKSIARSAISGLSEGASAAIDLGLGNVVNPHLALLFENVPLKQYSFNWTLSPRTVDESDALMNIIGRLKFHMHPSYSNERLTFEFPDTVDQELIGVPDFGENGSYLFKPAAITNVTADYSPQGGAYFEGGRPVVVNLSISFQEAEIFTQRDYSQFKPTSGEEK